MNKSTKSTKSIQPKKSGRHAAPVVEKKPRHYINPFYVDAASIDKKHLDEYICYKKTYGHFKIAVIFFILGSVIWIADITEKENKTKNLWQLPNFPTIVFFYVWALMSLLFVVTSPQPYIQHIIEILLLLGWMAWFYFRKNKY